MHLYHVGKKKHANNSLSDSTKKKILETPLTAADLKRSKLFFQQTPSSMVDRQVLLKKNTESQQSSGEDNKPRSGTGARRHSEVMQQIQRDTWANCLWRANPNKFMGPEIGRFTPSTNFNKTMQTCDTNTRSYLAGAPTPESQHMMNTWKRSVEK